MPLTEVEVDQALAATEGPNEPAALTSVTTSLHRGPPVSRAEARKRREVVSKLLSTGVSDDAIIDALGVVVNPDGSEGMALAEGTVLRLMSEVRKRWESEDEARAAGSKSAAVRRHNDHIRKASRKGAWNAVAMLESNLMKIEGNATPIQVNISGEIRSTNAILHVMGEMDESSMRKLIESERSRIVPGTPKNALPARVKSTSKSP